MGKDVTLRDHWELQQGSKQGTGYLWTSGRPGLLATKVRAPRHAGSRPVRPSLGGRSRDSVGLGFWQTNPSDSA